MTVIFIIFIIIVLFICISEPGIPADDERYEDEKWKREHPE